MAVLVDHSHHGGQVLALAHEVGLIIDSQLSDVIGVEELGILYCRHALNPLGVIAEQPDESIFRCDDVVFKIPTVGKEVGASNRFFIAVALKAE